MVMILGEEHEQKRKVDKSGAYSYEINLKVFLINKTISKSNNIKLDSNTPPPRSGRGREGEGIK